MTDNVTRVRLCPAEDVTDLDEWYARLDSAVSLEGDGRWRADSRGLAAELPAVEAVDVVDRARAALGEALVVASDDGPNGVTYGDLAGGRPVDE